VMDDHAPLVYREEVLAIIGAVADLVVDVHEIRNLLEGEDGRGEEEGNEEGVD
jgi:hypothetical protein